MSKKNISDMSAHQLQSILIDAGHPTISAQAAEALCCSVTHLRGMLSGRRPISAVIARLAQSLPRVNRSYEIVEAEVIPSPSPSEVLAEAIEIKEQMAQLKDRWDAIEEDVHNAFAASGHTRAYLDGNVLEIVNGPSAWEYPQAITDRQAALAADMKACQADGTARQRPGNPCLRFTPLRNGALVLQRLP